jgi:tetratricopeptide (TPR) repeat protein
MGISLKGNILAVLVVFLLIPFFVFSQASSGEKMPWWYTMERGKLLFRTGEYGDALLAFEDARRERWELFTRMERDFILFLSIPEVRRLGDSLENLEKYAVERGHAAASGALGELYYRYPREKLDNSAARALYELGRLKNYPDAEYWIGETYRAEGELSLALIQYRKALADRELFEIPGFDLQINYKIADIQKLRREYVEMAATYEKEILRGNSPGRTGARDTLWAEGSSFAKTAMENTLQNEGIDRFLTLYRYNNADVEPAHRSLGFFYYASGRYSPGPAQSHLMFAFLIQNTLILEEMIRNRYDFTYTNLTDLVDRAKNNPLLTKYMEDVEYYRTAYYLACTLYGAGKLASARTLWEFLSGQEDAGEWRVRSRGQLRSPSRERVVEMP